ncbi:MAG TPA: hypothetical protein VGW09_04620 [Nitrososphaeraceae archaeon]|nr:hypothetical protein [Nitrososphaeraceae archaeon]
MQATAQRLALLALGRAWIMLESRKNSKRGKCLKMPQNPQRPVHALLGGRRARPRLSGVVPKFASGIGERHFSHLNYNNE